MPIKRQGHHIQSMLKSGKNLNFLKISLSCLWLAENAVAVGRYFCCFTGLVANRGKSGCNYISVHRFPYPINHRRGPPSVVLWHRTVVGILINVLINSIFFNPSLILYLQLNSVLDYFCLFNPQVHPNIIFNPKFKISLLSGLSNRREIDDDPIADLNFNWPATPD